MPLKQSNAMLLSINYYNRLKPMMRDSTFVAQEILNDSGTCWKVLATCWILIQLMLSKMCAFQRKLWNGRPKNVMITLRCKCCRTLLAEPFLTVHMLCTEKRLCTNPVKFLLSMLSALLSNSFEPMPSRCSFLTVSFRRTFHPHLYLLLAGSVSIIGFSQKLMLALEKPVWRE